MAVALKPVENGVVLLLVYGRLVTNINPSDHRQFSRGTCQPIATCVPRAIWYLRGLWLGMAREIHTTKTTSPCMKSGL